MSEVSIKVAVRVRPLLAKEKLSDERACVSFNLEQNQIIIGRDRVFTFDHVFVPGSTQQEVYDSCVASSVDSLFEGYNVTVFAYGQTGCGKTYTMGGYDMATISPEEYGIMPRAIGSIFSRLDQLSAENTTNDGDSNVDVATQRTVTISNKYEYRVKVSYMEIYKEELKDLLDPEKSPKELHIREDEAGNTVLTGMTEADCRTHDDVFACLERGAMSRHTALTMMNEHSNRSHCILSITLEQYWLVPESSVGNQSGKMADQDSQGLLISRSLAAKFHFVDLAGSERVTKTGNVGDRFKESVHINSGLLSLGNVISALSDPKRRNTHVPYRDSKITRLLKDSLGGNSNTVMICCVSPAESSMDESINSLKYASRAKFIKNHPVVNMKAVDVHAKLTAQIQQLKAELEVERQRSVITSAVDRDRNSTQTQPQSTNMSATSVPRDNTQLKALLEEARELFNAFNNASDFRSVLNAHSDEQARIDDWLDVCDLALSSSDSAGDAKNDVQAKLENAKVRRLEGQLAEAREQLQHDESIFAEKNVEIGELHNRIDGLDKQLDYAARARDELMKVLKEREAKMVELQMRVDELNAELLTLRTGNGDETEGEAIAKRKIQTSPAQTEGAAQPAANIERIMQHFRARVRLLELSQLPHVRDVPPTTRTERAGETEEMPSDGEEQKVLVRDLLSADASKRLSNLKSSLETRGTFRVKQKNRKSVLFAAPDSAQRDEDGGDGEANTDNHHQPNAISGLKQREGEQKLKDLNLNIRLKEQLIQELVRNCRQNESLNKQFAGKIRELEAEKTRAKTEVTELQSKMQSLVTDAQARRAKGSNQAETNEDVQRIKSQYESRIQNATTRIAELQKRQLESRRFAELNSEKLKKMEDLETALSEMRQQRENLTRKLKEESDQKRKLESEIQREMHRVKELERKSENQEKILKVRTVKDGRRSRKPTNDQTVSTSELGVTGAGLQREETNEQLEQKRVWLDSEIEKVIEERTRIAEFERELQKREEILKKKEFLVKERAQLEIKKMRASQAVNDDIARLSTRLDGIDEELAERSAILGSSTSKQGDDAERRKRAEKEIAELQASRAKLEKQRVDMETRLYGNDERGPSILTEAEERRLIEVEEAIEAMDSAIAYKTEIIDRKGLELERQADALRASLSGVHTRLLQIGADEAKRLLMRYFDKVISLKEDTRKREILVKDFEYKTEEQATLIRQLESAIERQRAEYQRALKQERPRTSSRDEQHTASQPAAPEIKEKIQTLEKDLLYYKHTTRELRKKLRDLLGSNAVGASIVGASQDVGADGEEQHEDAPPGRHSNRQSHASNNNASGHVLLPTQPKSPRSSQARSVRVSRKELRELTDSEIQQRLTRASTNAAQNGPVAASHSVSVLNASTDQPEPSQRGFLLQHQSVIRVVQSDSTQPADSIQIQRDSLDAGNQQDMKLTYDEADDE